MIGPAVFYIPLAWSSPSSTGAVPCAPAESQSVELTLGSSAICSGNGDHGPTGDRFSFLPLGRVSPTGVCRGSLYFCFVFFSFIKMVLFSLL